MPQLSFMVLMIFLACSQRKQRDPESQVMTFPQFVSSAGLCGGNGPIDSSVWCLKKGSERGSSTLLLADLDRQTLASHVQGLLHGLFISTTHAQVSTRGIFWSWSLETNPISPDTKTQQLRRCAKQNPLAFNKQVLPPKKGTTGWMAIGKVASDQKPCEKPLKTYQHI